MEIILFGKSEERLWTAAHLDTKGLKVKGTDDLGAVMD